MISYISGMLAETGDKFIVVEASGVGYGINVPATLPARLGGIGSAVRIYTHLHISDDSQKLYGFANKEERELFRMLLSVGGVGPKVALSVLSVFTPDDLRLAIVSEDEKALSGVSGLGKKTASKIILELKDKFSAGFSKGGSAAGAPAGRNAGPREDAIAAMVELGYSASESFAAVNSLGDTAGMQADEILGLALRKLV